MPHIFTSRSKTFTVVQSIDLVERKNFIYIEFLAHLNAHQSILIILICLFLIIEDSISPMASQLINGEHDNYVCCKTILLVHVRQNQLLFSFCFCFSYILLQKFKYRHLSQPKFELLFSTTFVSNPLRPNLLTSQSTFCFNGKILIYIYYYLYYLRP